MSEVKTDKISSVSTNGDITLDPDGTGDVVVASGHKLGIGTTSPALPLEVNGSTNVAVFRSDASNSIIQLANSTGTGGDNGTLVGSVGDDLYFRASDAERVRIGAGGMAIGSTAITASAYTDITTNGAGLVLGTGSTSDGGVQIRTSSSGTGRIYFGDNSGTDTGRFAGYVVYQHSNNSMLFGTSSTTRLTIDNAGAGLFTGTVGGSGSYSNTTGSGANVHILSSGVMVRSTSSQRYKNTINDATHGLTELMTLRPVTYKHNSDGDTIFGGLIAEEVHTAGLTEFVEYSQDDNGDDQPEALHYGNMVSMCIKDIQELKTELDAEKTKTATLQTQVADLITRVTALEDA